MKTQKVSRWFSLLFIMLMIAGCVQSTEGVGTSSPEAPVLPVNGAPPTKIMASVLTLTPTSKPIDVPTLPTEDAHERLLELLATNGNCRLPCLWGITSGKSNNLEAQSILLPLSSIAETIYFNQPKVNDILLGAITPSYIENDFRTNVRVAYTYSDNGVVNRIGFRVLEEQVVQDPRDPSGKSWISKTPIYDSPTFMLRVEYYSLSHLLAEQGVPDSVSILASTQFYNLSGSIEIHIAVFYLNQGIWAHYTTFISEDLVP
jgi:hypothetical protein